MTERTGFDSEPTYPLAEQAENQVLRERLYAAESTVVRLENERRGKVLVDAGDLRQVLTLAARDPASWSDAERGAYNRTFDAAEEAVAAVGDGKGAQSAGALRASQRAGHLDPCTRCNGSGSEPDTDPDEAAGLVLVAREDVKWALAAISCYMPLGMVDEEQHAVLARLRDAAGHGEPGRDMAAAEAESRHERENDAGPVSQEAGNGTGALSAARKEWE